jgi:radical SAM superfamily enzyme YgiQ (UPF0313 family)
MRIGLIAMSGVRVVNPELIKAGVTLPQFVKRGEVIAQLPSLALILLAALTPEEDEVEYIEVSDLAEMTDVPTHYDFVGISSYTAMAYEMYELADRFRAAGVPVVLGGLHASFAVDEASEHADAVCAGEGETIWPRIVADFRHGGKAALQPVYREAAPGTYDLANSPMPRFELLRNRPYNRITVQTVRGCPLDCEFCGASKLYGPKYRRKPVAKVVAEIERIKEIWGDNAFFELADDNSFAHPVWSREFLHAIRDLDLRWFTETDISIADNDDILQLLADSGCRQILIGLESVNPGSLDGIDRSNWKYRRREQYIDAIRKIQSYGVTVNGCFIVGNDADDPSVFESLRDFISKSELLEAQVTVLTPFPGTRLLQRLRDEGRLLYDKLWNRCTLFDVVFEPKLMTADELEQGHRWLMGQIYNQDEFTKRKRHYIELVKSLHASGRKSPEAMEMFH